MPHINGKRVTYYDSTEKDDFRCYTCSQRLRKGQKLILVTADRIHTLKGDYVDENGTKRESMYRLYFWFNHIQCPKERKRKCLKKAS
jgi:hypothetical protein